MQYEIIHDSVNPISSNKIRDLIIMYVENFLQDKSELNKLVNIAKRFINIKANNQNELVNILYKIHNFYSKRYQEENENNQNITANLFYITNNLNYKIDCKTFAMINLMVLLYNKKFVNDIELIFSGNGEIQHVYLNVELKNGSYYDLDICNKNFNQTNKQKENHNILLTYQVEI